MKPNRQIVLKRIGILAAAVFLLFLLACVGIHGIYFSPYRDPIQTKSTFICINELLSPSLTYSDLMDESGNLWSFSRYTQRFYLHKMSYNRDEYAFENTGTIRYSFGRATVSDYEDTINLGRITTEQSIFMGKEDPSDVLGTIDPEKHYEVWIRFREPMSLQSVHETFPSFINNAESRPNQSGIIWIPIKSSDHPNDLCIGAPGNLSLHYKNAPGAVVQDRYWMDAYLQELAFRQSLQYLVDHSNIADIFLNSGLYEAGNTINFHDRLKYVQTNGVQCLGLVVYAPGRLLMEDRTLTIVKAWEC